MTQMGILFRISQAKEGGVKGLGREATYAMIVPENTTLPTKATVEKALKTSSQPLVEIDDCYCIKLIGVIDADIECFVNKAFDEFRVKSQRVFGVFFG